MASAFKSRVSAQSDAYSLLMARLSAPVEPRKAAAAARRERGLKAPVERVRAPREPRAYAAWDDDTRRRSVRDAGDVDAHTLAMCVAERGDGSSCGAFSHVFAEQAV